MEFNAYRRPDGGVGVRNHLAIIPSVFCANNVAKKIAAQIPGAIALTHSVGCSQVGADLEQTARVLKNLGRHPNVGAVLVVGLGCERFTASELFAGIANCNKPVEMLLIQKEGGILKTVQRGIELCLKLTKHLNNVTREIVTLKELSVGLECGGTDATSGIAANPVLGFICDRVVESGGTAIFNEVTELIGTETILASRAAKENVACEIRQIIAATEAKLQLATGDPQLQHRSALISTGNFEGGVSSVVEKALGNIAKTGKSNIAGTLSYGEKPLGRGLFLMDSPGHDAESVTGLVAGGCQIVLFTTGRGTPTGFPICPVLKITGNHETFEAMPDAIDFDASSLVNGIAGISGVGEQLMINMQEILSGKLTKAEILEDYELLAVSRL